MGEQTYNHNYSMLEIMFMNVVINSMHLSFLLSYMQPSKHTAKYHDIPV